MNSPVIITKNLTKHFGDFTAVNGINFEAKRGEIFGFLGPNGSGKTTTIRMMLGLLSPSSGDVQALGMSVKGNQAELQQRTGYMSQRFSLYNDLTVHQNLQFYGAAYGLNNTDLKSRIQDALVMAGLEGREKAKTKDLSGGWRQRLALSAAILHRPELIFLDEPTAGVDPISRRAFWDLLYQLVADKVSIFVTTHYMDEAEHCHRLSFIQRGNIIADGSPAEIKEEMMSGQVLEISSSDAINTVKVLREANEKGKISLLEVELYGALVHVVAPNVEKEKNTIQKLLKKEEIYVEDMAMIEASLEDVFIASMK
ncbi:MAG: ABC transporter ATP-binding protein [Anaerolineae bacterium]|mgnify:CR=1 FL=1|jgi:ABC-2 type transport system ATP-binding protein|nr:ABC transporter ATP-binding protein [Anaerolineae bacterium]MBT3714558.1 ABC transporter ATP-binding protein [Anaerolineae bacterium]MBT4309981.1 ABC transporter ATP-binding protein [Anaerolineae bacterium]MBT4457047.1 ABC transporter ATP-binding protein [Anaerolineae bacterium]MBT6059724.1 ABC transporter ATP-binding protein [Anaerolineae bacterium]